jgi:hypothetical protein
MLRIETFAPARRCTAPSTSSLRRGITSQHLSEVTVRPDQDLVARLGVVDRERFRCGDVDRVWMRGLGGGGEAIARPSQMG